jgi:hypothetical protein
MQKNGHIMSVNLFSFYLNIVLTYMKHNTPNRPWVGKSVSTDNSKVNMNPS